MGINEFQKKVNIGREIWLENAIDEGLKEESNVPKGGYFQVSVLGETCERLLFLHYHGLLVPEIFPSRLKRILDNGTITQERYEKYFKKIGLYKDKEVSIVSEDPPLHGRLDFLLSVDGKDYIIELKTINTRGFDFLRDNAKPEHEVQLQVYLNLFNVGRGGILYENTDTKEIIIFSQKKDKQKWQKIIDKCGYIMNLKELPDIKNVTHGKYCKCVSYSNKMGKENESNFEGIF